MGFYLVCRTDSLQQSNSLFEHARPDCESFLSNTTYGGPLCPRDSWYNTGSDMKSSGASELEFFQLLRAKGNENHSVKLCNSPGHIAE